jgi:hypothetical protein
MSDGIAWIPVYWYISSGRAELEFVDSRDIWVP